MGQVKHINSAQPTNNVLWQMFRQLQNRDELDKHINKQKYKNFIHNNGARIDNIADAIKKLQDEFFVIENNQIKLVPPVLDKMGMPVNPNAAPLPLMKPDKKLEDFQAKFQQLMSLTTTII